MGVRPSGQRADGKARTGGVLGGLWDDIAVHFTTQKCPYCLSVVPKAATKCSQCGEWLPEKSSAEFYQREISWRLIVWPVVLLPVAIIMMMSPSEVQRPKVERVLDAFPSKSAKPTDTEEGAVTEENPAPKELYVAVNVANLRSESSTESAIVAKLKRNDKVVEIGR